MNIENVKYYRNLDFEDYLKLPGTSYSSLKDQVIIPTEGMRLGTRVHNYILEPEKFDWQQVEIVKAIAAEIRKYLGAAINSLEKEISFTADFVYNGMVLPYKGRADLLRIGRIVIDLKILSGSLEVAIDRFGYDYQVTGYCLPTGADMALIIAYNKATKKVEVAMISPTPKTRNFWQYHIVSKGIPMFQHKMNSYV